MLLHFPIIGDKCSHYAKMLCVDAEKTKEMYNVPIFGLQMNFMDMANLLDNDGNMQNEMMIMAFAATLLSTIPVLLGL